MTVRAFYFALGVAFPAWSNREAPVRCFARPEAHHQGDRSPSCSVNLASGAWNCHGCGAHGGAYDAALAAGHSPRAAMELLIAHGPRRAPPIRPPFSEASTDPRASHGSADAGAEARHGHTAHCRRGRRPALGRCAR